MILKSFNPIWIVAGLTLALVGGCGASTEVTAEQEKNFRNPSKEIPPHAQEAMRKAMERAGNAKGQAPGGGAAPPTGQGAPQ